MPISKRQLTQLNLDLSPLGLEKRNLDEAYFCTPKGATIIGWAGVDGIHYCSIRGFGDMVFAVTPMAPAPHYVHPVAQSCSDFLRLLLSCGSTAPLDQAWQWDASAFSDFLAHHPPTREQAQVLEELAAHTQLSPMEHPWDYLQQLQANFDASKIPYSKEFYDLDLNPEAPVPAPEWKVTFEGGFWARHTRERPGQEVPIRQAFDWAGHHWLIPSLYLCSKGLVLDFCMRVEPSHIHAFLDKWDLHPAHGAQHSFSQQEQMQLELENPLRLDFSSTVHLNGRRLENTHSYGTAYNPCLGPEYSACGEEAAQAMEHYGLDPHFGWVILRACYPWATKRKPNIRTLSVTMAADAVSIPGPHVQVHGPGDTAVFHHGGQEHLLTVQEYEAQAMDWSHLAEAGVEYPNHYLAMSYTLTPELPDGSWSLVACDNGDPPRQAPAAPGQPVATNSAMVMAIDPIAFGETQQGPLHVACSSLHFQSVDRVEWRLVFYEKQYADLTVDLLAPPSP